MYKVKIQVGRTEILILDPSQNCAINQSEKNEEREVKGVPTQIVV